jgi:hypothetical protein
MAVDNATQSHALIYEHEFDPNCPDCQQRTFDLLGFQPYAPPGASQSVYPNPGQQFAPYPAPSMADDAMFQSLSDFEVCSVLAPTSNLLFCLACAVLIFDGCRN